jgi:hypothetical protein
MREGNAGSEKTPKRQSRQNANLFHYGGWRLLTVRMYFTLLLF